MVGELPRALDISGQWISITIQQNMKSSHNFEFREAVQFLPKSQLDNFCRYGTNITTFLAVSKAVVHSSYLHSALTAWIEIRN